MHSHTMWSGDSTTTLDELADVVDDSGIDVLCITDHNAIKGARDLAGELAHTAAIDVRSLFFGGRCDNQFNFEGKLDEIAVYTRALSIAEIRAHYQASGLTPP